MSGSFFAHRLPVRCVPNRAQARAGAHLCHWFHEVGMAQGDREHLRRVGEAEGRGTGTVGKDGPRGVCSLAPSSGTLGPEPDSVALTVAVSRDWLLFRDCR